MTSWLVYSEGFIKLSYVTHTWSSYSWTDRCTKVSPNVTVYNTLNHVVFQKREFLPSHIIVPIYRIHKSIV